LNHLKSTCSSSDLLGLVETTASSHLEAILLGHFLKNADSLTRPAVRFRAGKPQHRDLIREAKAIARGQYPAAIVFGCIDSRAPAELILDLGIGDIFSGRVAGNVADEDVLGSMEFACKVAGSKVVLVMATPPAARSRVPLTRCRLAISRHCWGRSVRPLKPFTTRGSARSENYGFVDAVARKNVSVTIAGIREQSSVLRELESSGSIKIAGSMYNLETGMVEFLE